MHRSKEWITRGFESFSRGTFGNGGENLHISHRGVLQRINLFDLNHNGYVDLVFCNGQAHFERPPAYVYSNIFNDCALKTLRSDGAVTGAVAI